jgi:hypothetical protein
LLKKLDSFLIKKFKEWFFIFISFYEFIFNSAFFKALSHIYVFL